MFGNLFSLRACAIMLALFVVGASSAQCGEFNPVLSVGDDSPEWKELPGTDDKQHSRADLEESDVIIVAFTCNSCPYAVDVEDRMNAIAAKYADKKVSLVAICVNRIEEDALPAMKKRAKEKEFSFAYLYDESQKIAKEFGALRTPEFFVINKDRKIVYMGAFDDSPDGKKVTKRHVESAVDAALKNEAPKVTETIAIGCGIRFKRPRNRGD